MKSNAFSRFAGREATAHYNSDRSGESRFKRDVEALETLLAVEHQALLPVVFGDVEIA
jgi:hypothetical protein